MSKVLKTTTIGAVLLLLSAGTGSAQTSGVAASVDGVHIEFQAGQSKKGQPVVSGYVYNDGWKGVANVRLLVETLDAQGQVIGHAQGVAVGSLNLRARGYFEVPITTPGPSYRVRILSWDTFCTGAQ